MKQKNSSEVPTLNEIFLFYGFTSRDLLKLPTNVSFTTSVDIFKGAVVHVFCSTNRHETISDVITVLVLFEEDFHLKLLLCRYSTLNYLPYHFIDAVIFSRYSMKTERNSEFCPLKAYKKLNSALLHYSWYPS